MCTSKPESKTFMSALWNKIVTHKDSDAIICNGQKTSYQSLYRQCSYINNLLSEQGNLHGQTVGIMLERGSVLVPAMLGCWSVGASFYPLDSDHPLERIQQYTSMANPLLIIADKTTVNVAKQLNCKVIEIDEVDLNTWEQECRIQFPEPHELAYILYTSGSTGTPKGVKISHRSLLNFMASMSERLTLTEKDTSLAHSTVCFDVSIFELLLPLYLGGTTLIATSDQASDPMAVSELLEEVTFIHATPSYLQILLATGWKPHENLNVFSGAEAIRPSLVKAMKGAKSIWNLYGPTEATIYASCYKIDQKDTVIPIGEPLENVNFYVIDTGGNYSEDGELYIGGHGVCLGYCSGDKASFIHHPETREVMYKTGDKVRKLPSGLYEWVGRSNSEIKVRGNRVAPKEIESVIEEVDAIDFSVVTLAESEVRDAQALTAYLTTNSPIEKRDMDEQLSSKLPQYMIPEHYIVLDEFPITANGKVDRKSLPKPNPNNILKSNKDFLSDLEIELPGSLVSRICDIFGSVTNIPRFPSEKTFSELGVNSISFFIAAQKISSELNVKVTANQIKNSENIIDLAVKINK
ncbi:hypothetical protein CW749_10210 [Vibrio sp. vnigr-6D03]|uniref:non-ribosomal peptide synthetase n=1 Tax=Vibrio sp. vnigr-6D03 TaxID=2058088 RepID=UPI000C3342CE|nr:non-ribosomal peptide synthetase [Vibrio sp. vnigr-6D03]PKF80053.1 hypothetical protein CW749_10210 [Vibrio sp. vnigr-6D03]